MGPVIDEGVLPSPWDDDDRMFQAITIKLEHSRQTCEEILKLYEIRADIEEDYGDRLLRLSQLLVGQNEEGTLAASISHVPSAMETTARAHYDLSQQLRRSLEAPLAAFLKDQEEKRRAQHQQIENSAQLRLKHSTNVVKLREHYTAECTKLSGMQKYLKEKMPLMSPKEVHQVEEDIIEQEQVVATAEQEFRRAEEVLKDVTEKWLSDWENACNIFQKLEKERIQFLQESLSGFANTMSNMYIVDEQCCGRIRSALEKTDVERDIKLFAYKYGYKSKSRNRSMSRDNYPGEQLPPPSTSLPPLPTALPPLPPIIPPSTSPTDSVPVPRAYSDTMITRQASDTQRPNQRSVSLASFKDDLPHQSPVNDNNRIGDQDTMSSAFQEVESMLEDVSSGFDSLSLSYKKRHSDHHSSSEINYQHANDSSIFTQRSKSPSSSSTSSRRKTDNNLRFKPIPNPEYYTGRNSVPTIPNNYNNTASTVSNLNVNNCNNVMNNSNSNDHKEEESESEDEFPPLARRKPREEKWMISSVRRPQQLPVLSQNAQIYRRS